MKKNKLKIVIVSSALVILTVVAVSRFFMDSPGSASAVATVAEPEIADNSSPQNRELINQIITPVELDKPRKTVELVNSLPNNLSSTERQALYDFLRHGPNDSYHYAVKNDIINVLRNQAEPPPELTDILLELYQDKNQDKVVRIYALQHMRPWYRMQSQKDPRIKEAFFSALDEPDTEFAGTALLAMRYLSKDQEGFDAQEIAGKAWKLAENADANLLSRISAIQVASTLTGKTGDGSRYVQYATSGNAMPIRLASIAAIGVSGDRTQLEFLSQIAANEPEPLNSAAKNAMKKIEN